MVKPLTLVKSLDFTSHTPQAKREKPKSRRDHRKEQRQRLKASKPDQRKIG